MVTLLYTDSVLVVARPKIKRLIIKHDLLLLSIKPTGVVVRLSHPVSYLQFKLKDILQIPTFPCASIQPTM